MLAIFVNIYAMNCLIDSIFNYLSKQLVIIIDRMSTGLALPAAYEISSDLQPSPKKCLKLNRLQHEYS